MSTKELGEQLIIDIQNIRHILTVIPRMFVYDQMEESQTQKE